jgi:hypothetical protein
MHKSVCAEGGRVLVMANTTGGSRTQSRLGITIKKVSIYLAESPTSITNWQRVINLWIHQLHPRSEDLSMGFYPI